MRRSDSAILDASGAIFMSLCSLIFLNVMACSPEETTPVETTEKTNAISEHGTNAEHLTDCGNLINKDQLTVYIDLVRATNDTGDSRRTNGRRLFASDISLTRGGQITHVTRDRIKDFTGKLPSSKDWQAIASALSSGKLESGGWRGCFISKGKAAFVADNTGNLGLSAFDFDRRWELPR